MKHIKTISIDQLKLGMFIVGMDQPWYRTPFLLTKRLIRHAKDIDLLKQHGIREVKIDSSRGLDVEPVPAGNLNPASHIHNAAASPELILEVPQASSDKPCQPASDTEKYAVEPLPTGTQQDVSHAQEPVAATQPHHPEKPASPEKVPLPAASGEETNSSPAAAAWRTARSADSLPSYTGSQRRVTAEPCNGAGPAGIGFSACLQQRNEHCTPDIRRAGRQDDAVAHAGAGCSRTRNLSRSQSFSGTYV